MMSEALVLSATNGAVRTLTLNRPQALNSFTAEMSAELRDALEAAAADAQVRCIVITGAGRAFCAGQDLAEAAALTIDIGEHIRRVYNPLTLRVRSMPVPVIAAINGVAAGAGANFALGCDLVIAARSATFIQAFSKIGLIPDCGGSWLLPHLVGRARAIGMAMTGDKLSAEEAQRIGLIWQVVDDATLADSAMALANRLAALPTRALAETRAVIDECSRVDFDDALTIEANTQRELGLSHDAKEGIEAFLAKRAPVFKDR
jgi:2-(1,2-epoxy-1,2-dihydrophenyl)acetyl-CoA isomerase